jgi:hypothetical protein
LRPHAEATKAKLVTMIQLRRFIRRLPPGARS